jgi:hypothetical protein
MAQLFGDERRTAAILEFLATTEVGDDRRRILWKWRIQGEDGEGMGEDEGG